MGMSQLESAQPAERLLAEFTQRLAEEGVHVDAASSEYLRSVVVQGLRRLNERIVDQVMSVSAPQPDDESPEPVAQAREGFNGMVSFAIDMGRSSDAHMVTATNLTTMFAESRGCPWWPFCAPK